MWWASLRAGAAGLRGPLVVGACVWCFVLGSVLSTPDPMPARPQPTSALTHRDVAELARALRHYSAAVRTQPPTTTLPAATTASSVLAAVNDGTIATVPTTTTTTTTSTSTSTTTTTVEPRDRPVITWPQPTSTVPPPDSVVAP